MIALRRGVGSDSRKHHTPRLASGLRSGRFRPRTASATVDRAVYSAAATMTHRKVGSATMPILIGAMNEVMPDRDRVDDHDEEAHRREQQAAGQGDQDRPREPVDQDEDGRPRQEADEPGVAECDDRARTSVPNGNGWPTEMIAEEQDDDDEEDRVDHDLDEETAHVVLLSDPAAATGRQTIGRGRPLSRTRDRATVRQASATPGSPASTRPIHQCSTPAASKAASTVVDAVGRDRREQAARGLRVVGEDDKRRRHVRRRARARRRRSGGCGRRRRSRRRRRRARAAPGSAGRAAASKTKRVPDARAISRPWPSRPNPVTSVAARTPAPDERLRGGAVEAAHRRRWRRPRSAALVRPWREPDTRTPVPSGLVRTSRSPGRAPPLRSSLSGWAAPMTASPYFGSGSRMVWPPASVPPASRTLDDAPAKISVRTSRGRSSGNAAIDRANRTRPPIANTSDRAFAAAISPNVRGSSTSGGKKSSVPMIARSSLTR